MKQGPPKRSISRIWMASKSLWAMLHCKRVFEEVRSKSFSDDGLFTTFNSTLNGQALTEWQAVYNALPEGTASDLAQLEQSIQALIAAFAVAADRHTFLQYLRHGFKKPKRISVQVLVTLFQQLNGVASWLPGNMPVLTAEELKQAYHDQMPSSWIERLAATGRTVPTETLQGLREYFGQQENMAKRLEDVNNARQSRSAGTRRRREEAAEGPQEQRPCRRRRSRHRRDERQAPERGQRQAQAPEARRENAASRAAGLRIADNVPCPVHPGAGHTWGECRENARNRANNRNNAPGAVGGQSRGGGPAPQQRGEAQGHYVETIDSTMEQEDVSELPGGPTEVSDPSPMEEEQFIIDERAPRAAVAESFPALSFPASPPSLDSTGRPTPVHRTRSMGASCTSLPPHTWGHRKSPGKQTVPRKEYDQPSAAAVKKAPQVAAPQPSPKDETPAPSESGNGEYLLPIFHFNPFGTAKAVQETHHLDLFSSNDSFFDQSLDPNRISIGTTMFPSTALLQPIDELIPSFPTITTCSCASSGSAPTYVSAKEELKWPEASWFTTAGTGKYGKGQTSPNGSTSHTRPVRLTALMSSTWSQPCKRSERATLKPSITKPTCGSTKMLCPTENRM